VVSSSIYSLSVTLLAGEDYISFVETV
jgi:hypothetical protein